MSKAKVGKKRKRKISHPSNSYVAVKSQNEVYYQMASIFKAVTQGEDKLAIKIFNGFISGKPCEIYLENSL